MRVHVGTGRYTLVDIVATVPTEEVVHSGEFGSSRVHRRLVQSEARVHEVGCASNRLSLGANVLSGSTRVRTLDGYEALGIEESMGR